MMALAKTKEMELLPDWCTMQSCKLENGKITEIVFRNAKDIKRLMAVEERLNTITKEVAPKCRIGEFYDRLNSIYIEMTTRESGFYIGDTRKENLVSELERMDKEATETANRIQDLLLETGKEVWRDK